MHRFKFLAVFSVALLTFATLSRARAADGVTVVKIATVAPEGTPWSVGLVEFKKRVEERSGGTIQVKPYFGGVLGDENESVQSCHRGQIQGVAASTGAFSSLVPELSVLEMPYLFRTAEEADHILDRVVLETVRKNFRDRGLVLGFWSENGYRSFGTTFGFIKSPADLAGHKMRSQETPLHLEMYRAFGASPVPIPVTEVLTSLQTGVIDGYDNTPLFAQAASWTEATKYFTITDHIYQAAAVAFNEAWFDALPADRREILLAAGNEIAPGMRVEIRALHPMLLENLEYLDVQVYKPTAAELATFHGPAATARETYLRTASPGEQEMYRTIVAALAEYRKAK